jgi:hypothetical protein
VLETSNVTGMIGFGYLVWLFYFSHITAIRVAISKSKMDNQGNRLK